VQLSDNDTEKAGRSALAERLTAVLKLAAPPVALAFRSRDDRSAEQLDAPVAAPNEHGRTGRAPAGCVFWMKAVDRVFATVAEDHANCSVGSFTHGFLSLEEAAGRDDVEAVLAAGWASASDLETLPHLSEKPHSVVYGPLATIALEPDVVLIRINGLALMTLKDAFPKLAVEGKPQCHIIPLAKEFGEPVASVGCALSRARTGLRADEMTCALPASRLSEIVDRLEEAAALDRAMARYAASDAKRFAPA
jgi:uncharacterized protein (DUF169 family)